MPIGLELKSHTIMNSTNTPEAALEVHSPDGSTRNVRVTETPYTVGRGEQGNLLPIAHDRLSRKCAAIGLEENRYYLEDRGNGLGVFVNGQKITRQTLDDGDVITFGAEIPYSLVFRFASGDTASIQNLVTRIGGVAETDSSGGLEKLNLLLEATRLLHSHLPLDTILDAMLDRAITVTDADRALLLEADDSGSLQRSLARRSGGRRIAPETFTPSQTAVNKALENHSAVITEDLDQADGVLQSARSVVTQRLRAVVAIPLYAKPRTGKASNPSDSQGQFLGVMYLDSRRKAAFSTLDRQILDAIAIESASIMDNARLVKLEQERQRVEQELNIARDIQQALLPRGIRDFPHVRIHGLNTPCHEVGGDYFDVLPMGEDRVAFLIADVSGKGLGAALLTTMLQGAFSGMTTGSQPERVFQHVNGFLCERSDVGRHATLFFATLDRDGNLEYVNAGHPPPMLLHHGEVKELFTGGSLPLGLIPGADYPVARTKLEPGDTLVLYSDGVTEAENPNEEFFGESRLQALLVGQQETPLDLLQQNIVKAVEQFSSGASQADDITVVLVRYRKPA